MIAGDHFGVIWQLRLNVQLDHRATASIYNIVAANEVECHCHIKFSHEKSAAAIRTFVKILLPLVINVLYTNNTTVSWSVFLIRNAYIASAPTSVINSDAASITTANAAVDWGCSYRKRVHET